MRLSSRLCASLFAFLCLSSPLLGQYFYKRVYVPDSNSVWNISYLTAKGIVCTDLPGQEVAIAGALAGADSSGFIQSAYLLQTDADGNAQDFAYYTDTAFFLQSGPRSFGLCHDGATGYYLSTGSNDNQVVIRTDNNGKMLWATDVNHHDFYGIICEGSQVTMLGQDESILGGHDYSAIQVDSSGFAMNGNLFGSTNFDIPIAIGELADGYLLTGQSFSSPRGMMVVKASKQLNLLWGDVLQLPGRQLFMQDMVTSPAGDAFFCTGRVLPDASGTSDSIFVAKLDTSGNPLWCRLYGGDTLSGITANAILADPAQDAILVGGNFDGTGYRSSFVLRLDADGNFLWAQDYADRDTSLEESVEALAWSQDGQSFYATGSYIHITPTFFTTHSLFVVHASLNDGGVPCDTALVLGHRNATLVPADVVFTYPVPGLPTNPYTYRQGFGLVNDSLRCEALEMVGIDPPRPSSFAVVNPAAGSLRVTVLADWEGGALELRDLGGRLVHRQVVEAGYQQLSIPAWQWSDGLYILSFQSQSGGFEAKKIILRNQ